MMHSIRNGFICGLTALTIGVSLVVSALPAAGRDNLHPLATQQSQSAASLMKSAAALEAAGKYSEAAAAYERAAKAFETAGQDRQAAEAYEKAAALYERAATQPAKGTGAAVVAAPKPATPIVSAHPAPSAPAAPKTVALPALTPERGHIIGRAVNSNGSAIPRFTVEYSGFEEGKLATTSANGDLAETVRGNVNGTAGRYRVTVPPGAYRASAYVTYNYRGRTYNFDMEPLNEPARHDYNNLGLDKLRNGLVRDFQLKLTGKKKNADESYEMGYRNAYYGGVIDLESRQVEYIIGGGHTIPKPLRELYPPDSRIELTLTPQGPLVDGSQGQTLVQTVRLGDDGRWQSRVRGIPVGTYTTTARLLTPDGQAVPLRISLSPAQPVHPNGQNGMAVAWASSVTVDFLPSDLGPMPRFGVKEVQLYLGL